MFQKVGSGYKYHQYNMSNIQRKIKFIFEDYKNKRFFFSSTKALLFALSPYINYGNSKKHHEILLYLKSNLSEVINQFHEKRNIRMSNIQDDSTIWVLWFQGENNMPPIVKACVKSIKDHAGQHKVILLSRENIHTYIDIPSYIYEKIEKKYITLTHFSDIVRMGILSKWGGWWMDATVFCTSTIMSYDTPFYSVKQTKTYSRYVKSGNKWTAYLLAVGLNNYVTDFIYKLFLEYWKKYDSMIDYYLVDYAIAIAYDYFPYFRKAIDNNPIDNDLVYQMEENINQPYSTELWHNLLGQRFNKLSWKHPFSTEGTIGEAIINTGK